MKRMTLIAASISTALLGGCMADRITPVPVFGDGDFVRSVVSNQRGQVVNVRCVEGIASCYYAVSFVGLSLTTNTSLIGGGGPISTEPLVTVSYMKDYELKAP